MNIEQILETYPILMIFLPLLGGGLLLAIVFVIEKIREVKERKNDKRGKTKKFR